MNMQINESRANLDAEDVMLRLPEVLRLVGVSSSTLWRMISNKSFPAPIQISRRIIVWKRSTVLGWINTR